jgi:hypothetical protein
MEDFFGGEMAVSKEQAAVIARGLYSLANVDGRVEREGMLIESLWMDAVGADSVTQLKELQRMPDVDSAELARELKTPELRTLFMKTAILLAYADSNYSEKERAWVKKTGKELGFDEKELGRFDDLVRNFLLSQLSHIHNTEATSKVAKKLGY